MRGWLRSSEERKKNLRLVHPNLRSHVSGMSEVTSIEVRSGEGIVRANVSVSSTNQDKMSDDRTAVARKFRGKTDLDKG